MKIELTEAEYKELKAMHKKTKDGRERDKLKAIGMLSDGFSQKEIARVLFLDEETIGRWRDYFLGRKSMTDWLKYSYVGYSGKLTETEQAIVQKYVEDNIISDSKQVQKFIYDKFSKSYKVTGIASLLHRLGFVYKLTTLTPSKCDPEKQAEFKANYEKLEAELPEDEVILHMDGVHPQHNTTCTRAWIKKGETKEIKSNTGRERVNICGAYNPHTQEVIAHEDKTINADTMIATLKLIEVHYVDKSKIYCIVDNAKYHRNKKVQEYLLTSRIELMFLPPYSPNLNLIERLWKFMRKKVINNRYYEKFTDFKNKLLSFFENIPNEKSELASFVGTKLHLLQPS